MSDKALTQIYHKPKDFNLLGGVNRLQRRARKLYFPGATRQTIQEYLKSEQAYTLHKLALRRFTRNHTCVAGIDDQLQADLVDMQSIARQNGIMSVEYANAARRYLILLETFIRSVTRLKLSELRYGRMAFPQRPGASLSLRTHAPLIKQPSKHSGPSLIYSCSSKGRVM